jgi:hypothetical protein
MTPSRARIQPRGGERSNTEREFPSDKVYRRDDGGVGGVESLSAEGLAFVVLCADVAGWQVTPFLAGPISVLACARWVGIPTALCGAGRRWGAGRKRCFRFDLQRSRTDWWQSGAARA